MRQSGHESDVLSRQATVLSYAIDAGDVIKRVGGDWDGEATRGQSGAAKSDAVIGTDLMHHVTDGSMRAFLGRILGFVRRRHEPFELAYRCDTPSHRQVYRMVFEPLGRGGVEVSHHLLLREPQETPLADPSEPVRICSICARTTLPDDWSDRRPGRIPGPGALHGICPSCASLAPPEAD